MTAQRKIEIFSAGCPVCEEAVALVNRLACSSCEVTVLDMHQSDVAARARNLGIRPFRPWSLTGGLPIAAAWGSMRKFLKPQVWGPLAVGAKGQCLISVAGYSTM